jgi:plasmid maintenance system antidote protein VapI
MSYRMRIDPRASNSGRFVYRVQGELQKALEQSGLKQQEVADRLGVDRSTVNRRLTGRANLTLRSIADLAWAMEHELHFSLKPKTRVVSQNEHSNHRPSQQHSPVESSTGSATPTAPSVKSGTTRQNVSIYSGGASTIARASASLEAIE